MYSIYFVAKRTGNKSTLVHNSDKPKNLYHAYPLKPQTKPLKSLLSDGLAILCHLLQRAAHHPYGLRHTFNHFHQVQPDNTFLGGIGCALHAVKNSLRYPAAVAYVEPAITNEICSFFNIKVDIKYGIHIGCFASGHQTVCRTNTLLKYCENVYLFLIEKPAAPCHFFKPG
ncbi:MAG: hypothetical protein K0Q79_388 [Flavipsychrobacter sp.]|nr:hypothetical protein [Flavipsychrobacter sp.]